MTLACLLQGAPAAYKPPPVDGGPADVELRRLNSSETAPPRPALRRCLCLCLCPALRRCLPLRPCLRLCLRLCARSLSVAYAMVFLPQTPSTGNGTLCVVLTSILFDLHIFRTLNRGNVS